MQPLADALPPKVRSWVYRILATAFGIELVVDVIDSGLQDKILGVLAVFGFVLAANNTVRPSGADD